VPLGESASSADARSNGCFVHGGDLPALAALTSLHTTCPIGSSQLMGATTSARGQAWLRSGLSGFQAHQKRGAPLCCCVRAWGLGGCKVVTRVFKLRSYLLFDSHVCALAQVSASGAVYRALQCLWHVVGPPASLCALQHLAVLSRGCEPEAIVNLRPQRT
jgi:hypothetical protein